MSWSNLEMNELKTGDKRLDKRVKCTIEKLAKSSESSFPSCFKTRTELVGAYRLFDNDFVTPEKILSAHDPMLARLYPDHLNHLDSKRAFWSNQFLPFAKNLVETYMKK